MENKKHNLNEAYLNSLTEDQRIAEMEKWTPEEVAAYLCPQGTVTLEEFREYGHQLIHKWYNEECR